MRFLNSLVIISIISLLVSCSSNNIDRDDSVKIYFDQHKLVGSFGMFDNARARFTIFDLDRYKDSAYLPASTFKIVNSLIGIETGKAKDDSAVIPWNGRRWPVVEECNADLPMYKAFRYSCVPWFQQLAVRIGLDTMQRWLDTLGYGQRYTKPVVKKIDTFWLDNSVKVTADEQLGLVKRLYFLQLPFQHRTQRIVKSMMLMEDNANYKLSYKTGWGHDEKGNTIGWIIGWIEENRHPYFFALQVQSPDPNANITSARLGILKSILKQYGFFEGKK